MDISTRADAIAPSVIFAITAKAREMKAAGVDVVAFGAGEPDYDTPEPIKRAAIKAIQRGYTKYTQTAGLPELRQAICDKLQRENKLTYTPRQIIVANGAKQILFEIMQVLIDPGDEVVIPIPYWVSYPEMVKLAGGTCAYVNTHQFKLTPSDLSKVISKKTKVLILNSPNNPTGAVYTRSELRAIAEICVDKGITIVSDEIYEHLIYDGGHVSVAGLSHRVKDATIIVNGLSKAYAMTGWRVGYCAAPEPVARALNSLQDHLTSSPCTIAQHAAIHALNGSQDSITLMRDEYRKRRDYMVTRLSKMPGVSVVPPQGAFYIFPDVSRLYSPQVSGSLSFCQGLLETEQVAAIPGAAFGSDEHIRLSFAVNMSVIREGLDRLEHFCESIQPNRW